MIDRIIKYAYDKNLNPELGFAPKTVKWLMSFDKKGVYLGISPLGEADTKKYTGYTFKRCPDLTQPELIRIKGSHFLIETCSVVALFGSEIQDSTERKHHYFTNMLRGADEVIPGLCGVAEGLENDHTISAIQRDLNDLKAKATDKCTIRLDGSIIVETEVWHNWWRNFRKSIFASDVLPHQDNSRMMVCFGTGEMCEPKETHPKIKGLADVGGQPSGSVLVGFDKDSFSSYGLEKSKNAAMSEQTVAAYVAGLNDLIANQSQRLVGARMIHWFNHSIDVEDDPFFWLESSGEQEAMDAKRRVEELLASLKGGKRPDLGCYSYYAINVSGSGGRVMVRDWMQGEFAELVENINKWFDDLSIVHRDGGGIAKAPKFLAVLGATVRDLKDIPAPFINVLWKSAIKNEMIPHTALAKCLSRTVMDIIQNNPSNHARMGLLKAYHIRKGGNPMSAYLNEEHPEVAYHCGRLMAVLSELQSAALPGVDAGIVQRYYAAASSTPAIVLGRLIKTSQFHLNKLGGGLAYIYEQKIAEICSAIKDAIPVTLTLEQQSLFALGYYQQLAKDRGDRAAKAAAKKDAAHNTQEDNNNESDHSKSL